MWNTPSNSALANKVGKKVLFFTSISTLSDLLIIGTLNVPVSKLIWPIEAEAAPSKRPVNLCNDVSLFSGVTSTWKKPESSYLI